MLKLSVAKLQNVLMQALHSMSSFVADPPNINGTSGSRVMNHQPKDCIVGEVSLQIAIDFYSLIPPKKMGLDHDP